MAHQAWSDSLAGLPRRTRVPYSGRSRDEGQCVCQVLIVDRHGDAEVEEDGTANRCVRRYLGE